MEDELHDAHGSARALKLLRLPATLDDRAEIALDCDGAAVAILRLLRPESNDPAGTIDVRPAEADELAAAPRSQVGEAGEVLEIVRQRGHHRVEVRALEEALPGVALGQPADGDHARQRAAPMRQPQRRRQQTSLAIH